MHPDPLLSLGLATALRQQDGIHVHSAGQAGDDVRTDVVVTNYEHGLSLASMDGAGHGRILVITLQDREQEVRAALEAGVYGYLLVGCRVEEVLEGISALARGQRYMCTAVAQRIADSMSRKALTSREGEVLELLAGGHCNKTIARDLGIALGTVKAHVKGIMSKLEATSRTQAVSIAVARGLASAVPVPAAPAAARDRA